MFKRLVKRPFSSRSRYGKRDYVLMPGRYVGEAQQVATGEPCEDMARLMALLNEQFTDSARLESVIRENVARMGYGR